MSALLALCIGHSPSLTPSREPLYELWYQATQSRTAATVFILIIAVLWLFTLIGVQQTASRLTWSFARDDALIWSDYIKRVDIALKLPVWAMLFNFVWTSMLGCIYLASSTGNVILLYAHQKADQIS